MGVAPNLICRPEGEKWLVNLETASTVVESVYTLLLFVSLRVLGWREYRIFPLTLL